MFGKTPEVVVSFEQQLDNLVRFCCDPKQFSVLGIDPTFSLGSFFCYSDNLQTFNVMEKDHQQPPCFHSALLYPCATGNPDILLFPILFAWQEECSAAPESLWVRWRSVAVKCADCSVSRCYWLKMFYSYEKQHRKPPAKQTGY